MYPGAALIVLALNYHIQLPRLRRLEEGGLGERGVRIFFIDLVTMLYISGVLWHVLSICHLTWPLLL